MKQLIEVANAEGQKQCDKCRRVVSLLQGCNHIKCACSFEFCYECGKKVSRDPVYGGKNCSPKSTCSLLSHRRLRTPMLNLIQWKTCTCQIWDEARLLARANVIVDRNEPQAIGLVREAAVDAVVRHINYQHESDDDDCDHEWERIDGGHECDECGDELPYFIWRCEECEIYACTRCRYNKL